MWQMVMILNVGEGCMAMHYAFSFPVALIKLGRKYFKRTVLCFTFSNSRMGITELVLSMPWCR